jgi:small subunit ribosomal protein S6
MTILSPDVAEDAIPAVLDRIGSYVTAVGGTVTETLRDSPWGRRRLAYAIRHDGRDVRDGYYTVYHLDLAPSRVDDVEREIKLNTDIIRYLLTHYTPVPVDPRAVEDAEIAAEDAAAAAYAAAQAEVAASASASAVEPAEIEPVASEQMLTDAPPATLVPTEPEMPATAATDLVATAEDPPTPTADDGDSANTGDRAADVADPTSVPQPLDDTATTDGARHGGNGTQTVDEGPGGDAAPDRGA